MTNEDGQTISDNVKKVEYTKEEEAAIAAHQINSDHFLSRVVAAVNEIQDGGYDVTLSIGGQLITGRLVSAIEYFAAMELELVPNMDPATAGTANGPFGSFTETYRDPSADQVTVYLHLRDAQYVYPETRIPSPGYPGIWWRGRISAVDGFSFGRMGRSDDTATGS